MLNIPLYFTHLAPVQRNKTKIVQLFFQLWNEVDQSYGRVANLSEAQAKKAFVAAVSEYALVSSLSFSALCRLHWCEITDGLFVFRLPLFGATIFPAKVRCVAYGKGNLVQKKAKNGKTNVHVKI